MAEDPKKKTHRFRPGQRAKQQMVQLRLKTKWDKPGMSYRNADRAVRSVLQEIQTANPGYEDLGRIGRGGVRRLRQVLEIRAVRMLEGARLVRDVGKPRPGQLKLLQARHVNAVRGLPGILSGRALVDIGYIMHPADKLKRRRRRSKKAAADDAEEPASGQA